MELSVASLHVYPVKSLGGFSVEAARLTDRGFEHDRRWMLVTGPDQFLTQREVPAMACLHCSPRTDGFRVTDIRDGSHIDLPWAIAAGEERSATVWDDPVHVLPAPLEISAWFAERLRLPCRSVFMPDSSHRPVDNRYAAGITSLSDGFPYLIISQASLDDLNARGLARSNDQQDTWIDVPMERFRPNIVLAGGTAFQEDGWKEIVIGDTRFSLVKPCSRCVITTTDQFTGQRGKEPLRTLATYRKRVTNDGSLKVDFGMNAMGPASGAIGVGDKIMVVA
jgi:uncharacterized protein YcbX